MLRFGRVFNKISHLTRSSDKQAWVVYNAQRNYTNSENYASIGWNIIDKKFVSDFGIEATLLEHDRTKSHYLHMGCPDANKAFSINLRTTPKDSTGVAHILEHTTLCGSHKYPVRDPFMKMLNRSLATFMNAMTGPDYTLYPFSTCNEQDFYNLLSVYMDSVFKPLLREHDFLQEGWRLEHEETTNRESPLVVKGVVFNEMKGAYANAQSMFGQKLQNNLYSSNTYQYSSGGFPLHIPGLTWEALKTFHADHYHPSNARFLSYGDMDLEKLLRFINDEYLSKFNKISVDTEVTSEPRWTSPKREHVDCAVDPMNPDKNKQSTVAVSLMMSDITDIKTSLALQILSELLVGGPSSPLYQSLIVSGLGSNFGPGTGFDEHYKDTNFTISLQNVDKNDVEKILTVIEETIEKSIVDGFAQERIDAVLHSYELALKHKSANFGVNLIMSLTPFWNHANNPIDYLEVSNALDWFKQNLLENKTFLQDMMKQYLSGNPHKLVQTMSPTDDFEAKEQKMFDNLQNTVTNLSEEEKDKWYHKSLELQKMQFEKEDFSCLPSLHVSDIKSEYDPTVMETRLMAGVPVISTLQPTNDVSYFRAMIDTSQLSEDLKVYLPVFSMVLTKLGAGHLGYAALDTEIDLRTGGLSAGCNVAMCPENVSSHMEYLLLSSHCLDRNIEHMYYLWRMIFTELHLDNKDRIAQLLKMAAAEAVNGVAHAGHRYAMTAAASGLSPAAARQEQYSGMSQVQLLSKLSSNDVSDLTTKLQTIAEALLNKNRMKCALHSTNNQILDKTETFLSQLPGEFNSQSWLTSSGNFQAKKRRQHYVSPFPINFTSQSISTVHYTHPDYPALRVTAALMGTKFLHPEIREKGGAYGGGASASDGAFTYYSYRDPKNLETFTVYSKSVDWALADNFDQADVNEAILRVFQSVDSPVTPNSRGTREFLSGVSDQTFAEHRMALKGVKVQDVKRVVNEYLMDPPLHGMTMIGGVHPGLDDLGWEVHNS